MKRFMKLFICILSVLLLVNVSSCGHEEENTDPYDYYAHVNYSDKEYLSMYIPRDKEKTNKTAILFVSGDLNTLSSKADQVDDLDLCKEYAEKGYLTATMSYHQLGIVGDVEYNITTLFSDFKVAIDKLVKTAKDFKGTTIENIVLHGRDFGGALVTIYANAIQSIKDNPEIIPEVPIKFIVNLSGPMSFKEEHWAGLPEYVENNALEIACKLVGTHGLDAKYLRKDGTVDTSALTPEMKANFIELASPISYIDANSLPMIFAYSQQEQKGRVKFVNSQLLEDKFTELHLPYVRINCKNSFNFIHNIFAIDIDYFAKIDIAEGRRIAVYDAFKEWLGKDKIEVITPEPDPTPEPVDPKPEEKPTTPEA